MTYDFVPNLCGPIVPDLLAFPDDCESLNDARDVNLAVVPSAVRERYRRQLLTLKREIDAAYAAKFALLDDLDARAAGQLTLPVAS